MTPERPRGFATRAIHPPAEDAEVPPRPLVEPLIQSASFAFASADEFADVINERRSGYSYSRLENPTVEALARALADLEGGEAALCFASGMAALHAAVASLCRAGDHVVAGRQLYGGSYGLAAHVLPRFGVEVTFADATDAAAVAAALRPETRLVLCETIANPTLAVADLPGIARVTRPAGVVLLVDNTFASPYLCNPLAHGADLVMHSATKYLGGHGDLIAGALAGRRDLVEAARTLTIDVGGVCAPLSAWLCLRGLKTLALRMDRHCASAAALADHLASDPRVARVHYPGLPAHPQHARAAALLRRPGGMVAFELAGGVDGGRRFLDALRIIRRAGSLGDAHSLALHPASTSHRQLPPDERRAGGIADGLVRLSVGLEDVEDLRADLDQALGAA